MGYDDRPFGMARYAYKRLMADNLMRGSAISRMGSRVGSTIVAGRYECAVPGQWKQTYSSAGGGGGRGAQPACLNQADKQIHCRREQGRREKTELKTLAGYKQGSIE